MSEGGSFFVEIIVFLAEMIVFLAGLNFFAGGYRRHGARYD